MAVTLQAVVALDSSRFTGGLSTMSAAVSNGTQAMMVAFGGLGGEIVALGHAFGPIGAAVGIFKEATTHGITFEQAMANVRSVTQMTAEDIGALGVEALNFSRNTRFSADEAAKALYALGSAGISTSRDLMDALRPSLLLAGATMSSTDMTAEAVTSTVQNLGLRMSDAGRVADQFAGVIAKTPANMERLYEALKFAAPVAGAFGIKLEDLVGNLGAFHLAGLKGEMAGTSFRMAILELTEAAATGGTRVKDALSGWSAASEGLVGAIRRFEKAGISGTEVATEFGARSGTGLAALLNVGSAAIDDIKDSIAAAADVQGMYNVQMDTLSGRLAVLGNSLAAIGHAIYESVQPALSAMTETATAAVNWMGQLVDSMAAGDWGAVWDQISTGAVAAFEAVRAGATSMVARIREGLAGVDWSAAWGRFRNGFVTAVTYVAQLRTAITDWLTQALSNVNGDSIRALFADIGDMASQVMPALEAAFASTWALVGEMGRVAVEVAKEAWRGFAAWLGSLDLAARWDGLMASAGDAATWVRNTVTAAIRAMAAELQELLAVVPAPLRDGFGALVTSLAGFGQAAMAAIGPVVDLVRNLGTSILTAVTNSGMVQRMTIWFGSLADSAGHVVNAMSSVVRIVTTVIGTLAGIADSDAFVWALTMAFDVLSLAIDGIVNVIHMAASALDWIGGVLESVPGPVWKVVGAIAGGAGLVWALGMVSSGLAAAAAGIASFASASLVQLMAGLPGLVGKITELGTSLGPMAKAGMIAGAAMAGWELGKLIRELPGVSEWCDKLAVSIWKMTGMMVEQDPELEKRVASLRAQREAQDAAMKAEADAAAAVRAGTAAVEAAVDAVEDLPDVFEPAAAAIEDVGVAAVDTGADLDASVAEFLAISDAAAAADAELDDYAAGFSDLGNAATKATKQLSEVKASAKEMSGFQMKVELPKLDQYQVALWADMKKVFAGIQAMNFQFKVEVPALNQYQVAMWGKMKDVFASIKALNFQFKVEVPALNQYQVTMWGKMKDVFAGIQALNFQFKVDIPKLDQNQVKLWEKFMAILGGGGGIKVPDAPNMNANLTSIAKSLERLAGMKGVIWT